MRIVHIANFYGPNSGGLRTTMHALGAGYGQRGHDVVLIVPGHRDDDGPTPYGRRIRVRSPIVPFTGGYRVMVRIMHVRRIVARLRPDVVEVSDRTTLRSLGRWARRRGINAVFFNHERVDGVIRANLPAWLVRLLPVERIANWHNRATARCFTTVVCTTAYARVEFERAGLGSVTISLGVDLDVYHPRNASESVRARWVEPGEALVVMASRLSPEKHPELAIDAIGLLAQRGVRVRLVSAGVGKIAERMHARAQGLPVTFAGFVTDRAEFAALLASADVVVAPGPIETFGLAALEALASGTPVVVNKESALPEVVADAGVAVAGTAQGFADGIAEVLARGRDTRRARARQRAETMPWSATIDALLALHTQTPAP